MDGLHAAVEMTYAPSAILNLFNNALQVAQAKKLIRLKGIFVPGKGSNYNGFFYDCIRDESSDAQLTLLVPALMRPELSPGKTISFWGYITKRVVNNGGRIEVQVVVSELLEQVQNKYSEKDFEALELQKKKAALGYRDVTSFIKTAITEEKPPVIRVLIGNSAIIDSDIKHQLRESLGYYKITFHRINLSSEPDIIRAVQQHSIDTDILVLSRGGGENLEIFNRINIAAACLSLKCYLVTAIGHKEDITLLQQVADKSFIVPAAFGQYLNELYNETIEQQQHSKARLVASVTAQLKANYEKQVENLNEKLKQLEELKVRSTQELSEGFAMKEALLKKEMDILRQGFQEQVRLAEGAKQQQLDQLSARLAKTEAEKYRYWLLIVAALVAGMVVSWVMGR
ncbi:MAG: hypothetical protein EOP49_07030 [Sphingobacteriales bacterium]|nr:MAG: hypothetical protein EOP49_07030 [Sphingobacteriales bacterium]